MSRKSNLFPGVEATALQVTDRECDEVAKGKKGLPMTGIKKGDRQLQA